MRRASPFPVVRGSYTIVDERCFCGALRSAHADLPNVPDAAGYGHGGAPGCVKYRWRTNVTVLTIETRGATPPRRGTR